MKNVNENDWIFTDPHFQHHRLVEWGDRPEGFEELISVNWKLRVGETDTVYCLGDVCFKAQSEAHAKYVQAMPGYKILIRGNHDNQRDSWYLSHGWNEVHDSVRLVGTANGRHTRILLSHVPQKDDNSFDLNIHGHFHANVHRLKEPEMQAILTKKHLLLSLEAVNYDFVRLNDLANGRIEQKLLDLLNEGVK